MVISPCQDVTVLTLQLCLTMQLSHYSAIVNTHNITITVRAQTPTLTTPALNQSQPTNSHDKFSQKQSPLEPKVLFTQIKQLEEYGLLFSAVCQIVHTRAS